MFQNAYSISNTIRKRKISIYSPLPSKYQLNQMGSKGILIVNSHAGTT